MVDTYRDELAAAHRRIEQLETVLGIREKPPRPPRRKLIWPAMGAVLLWLAAGGIFFVGCVGVGIASLFDSKSPETYAPSTAPKANVDPPAKHIWASWYPQSGVLPAVTDVDDDGVEDIVGLFWRAGKDDQPLYAAAIDGKTFGVKWSAGPYPAQWNGTRTHLVVVGRNVVVTDSQDGVHVLALADGSEVAHRNVEGGIVEACARPNNDGVLVRTGNDALWARLEVPTGELRERYEGGTAYCPFRDRGLTGDVFVTTTANDTIVARERGKPKTALWTSPAVLEGDAVHYGGYENEVRGSTLVTTYQLKNGSRRIVARDVRTGREKWHAAVPHSAEGSYMSSWGIEDHFVFVVINQTLHVFDVTTGEYIRGIDASTT